MTPLIFTNPCLAATITTSIGNETTYHLVGDLNDVIFNAWTESSGGTCGSLSYLLTGSFPSFISLSSTDISVAPSLDS